jgi:hypothetical protein
MTSSYYVRLISGLLTWWRSLQFDEGPTTSSLLESHCGKDLVRILPRVFILQARYSGGDLVWAVPCSSAKVDGGNVDSFGCYHDGIAGMTYWDEASTRELMRTLLWEMLWTFWEWLGNGTVGGKWWCRMKWRAACPETVLWFQFLILACPRRFLLEHLSIIMKVKSASVRLGWAVAPGTGRGDDVELVLRHHVPKVNIFHK